MNQNMHEEGIRAAVAGCLSIDICPRFVSSGNDFGDIIKPGQITHIEGNDVFAGGSVANTGIAMKLFGVEPLLLGRIGGDSFGRMLQGMLRDQVGAGADTVVVDHETPTAYSLILAPEGLDRAILQNPGANDAFRLSDIDWEQIKGCRLMHFGHPPTIRHFYENDGCELEALFAKAREMDMVTSLDLCAVDPASEAGRADWGAILRRVLPLVDFFVPSRQELADMLGAGGEAAVSELIDACVELGATNILIKEGENGMSYRNGCDFSDIERKLGRAGGSMADWEGCRGHAPAVKAIKEVSGLGAGDTSIAAYLSAMMRGFSFEDTLYLARAEGALCVSDASATAGLRPLEAVLFRA
ncbi:MAG: carbohydrate kinase family protein [Bacillota bacterium]|nr:carbohydrate kinase family protein [Bacillota bacterium]